MKSYHSLYGTYSSFLQRYWEVGAEENLKRIPVYYPKDPQLFKSVPKKKNVYHVEKTTFKLLSQISSKYSRNHSTNYHRPRFKSLKKALKNRNLQELYLSQDPVYSPDITKALGYARFLKSIVMEDVLLILPSKRIQALLKSNLQLQDVTFYLRFPQCPGRVIAHLMKIITEVVSLKRFNFRAETPKDFCLDIIPFETFRKRNVTYKVELIYSGSEFKISPLLEAGLAHLEFLGISFDQWIAKSSIPQKGQIKAIENIQGVLSLIPLNRKLDLFTLFTACRNIIALKICMLYHCENYCFKGLKQLLDLQHLDLILSNDFRGNNGSQHKNLFQNLPSCVQQLKSFHLVCSGAEEENHILKLFRACSRTLSYFTLSIEGLSIHQLDLRIFYTGLSFLEKLQYLDLSFKRVYYEALIHIPDSIETLRSLPIKSMRILSLRDISESLFVPSSLEELEIRSPELNPESFSKMPELPKLRRLELSGMRKYTISSLYGLIQVLLAKIEP